MEKKQIEIDINKMIFNVYNKIALWNNDECEPKEKSIKLKVLSHDLITDITTDVLKGLDGVSIKEKVETEKK